MCTSLFLVGRGGGGGCVVGGGRWDDKVTDDV